MYPANSIFSHIFPNPLSSPPIAALRILAEVPVLWFIAAQAAKRCHDIGKSGWWQLIPVWNLLLIDQKGDADENEYGASPKRTIQNVVAKEQVTVS